MCVLPNKVKNRIENANTNNKLIIYIGYNKMNNLTCYDLRSRDYDV